MRPLSLRECHGTALQSSFGQSRRRKPAARKRPSGTKTVPPQSSSAANQETEIAGFSRGVVLLVSGGVVADNTVI